MTVPTLTLGTAAKTPGATSLLANAFPTHDDTYTIGYFVSCDGGAGVNDISGYTRIQSTIAAATGAVFHRKAPGAATPAETIYNTGGANEDMIVVPFAIPGDFNIGSASASATCPSVITTEADCLVIRVMARDSNFGAIWPTSTEVYDDKSDTSGGICQLSIATAGQALAGASGTEEINGALNVTFTVAIAPPGGGGGGGGGPSNIGLIVNGLTPSWSTGDTPMVDRIEAAGHTVTGLATAGGIDAADVAGFITDDTLDMLLVSSSNVLDNIRPDNILDTNTVGVLHAEGWVYNNHNLAQAGLCGETSATYKQVTIVAPSHPLAAGLSGTVSILSTAKRLNYVRSSGMPPGAVAIATVAGQPDFVTLWAIEEGGLLADGVTAAPARIVGFPFSYDAPNVAMSDGWSLFDAAVTWILDAGATLSPSATGVMTFTGSGQAEAIGAVDEPELIVEAAWGVDWDTEPVEYEDGSGVSGLYDAFDFDDPAALGATRLGAAVVSYVDTDVTQIDGPRPGSRGLSMRRSEGYALVLDSTIPPVDADWAYSFWCRISDFAPSTGTYPNEGDPSVISREAWAADGFRLWYNYGTGADGSTALVYFYLTNSGNVGSHQFVNLSAAFGLYRDDFVGDDAPWLHVVGMYRHADGSGRLVITHGDTGQTADSDWMSFGQIVDVPARVAVVLAGWQAGDGDWVHHLADFRMFTRSDLTADELARLAARHPWSDITADIKYNTGVSWSRGRSSNLGAVEPGSASFRLENRGRRYEPGYDGSPLFPHVRTMTHVRVKARWRGVDRGMFRGFIHTLRPVYPNVGHTAVVDVVCVDRDAIAARTRADGGYLSAAVADVAGAYHYPLDDTDPAGRFREVLAAADPNGFDPGTNWVRAEDTFTEAVSRRHYARKVVAATYIDPLENLYTTGPLSVMMWFRDRGTTVDYAVSIFQVRDDPAVAYNMAIRVTPTTGKIEVGWGATLTFVTVAATSDLFDGDWHHLAVVRSGSGSTWAVTLFIDGAPVADVTGPATAPAGTDPAVVIALGWNLLGNFAEVSWVPIALSDEAVAEVYSSWLNVLPEQTTSERVALLLSSYVGVPVDQIELDTGATVMPSEDVSGVSVRDSLTLAQVAEMGLLFVDGYGVSRFHGRGRRTATAPTTTIGIGQAVPIADIRFLESTALRSNTVVAAVGDGSVSAIDPVGVARDGELRTDITLRSVDVGLARSYVDHVLATRSDVGLAIDQLTIRPMRDPAAMMSTALGLELSDRVAVFHRPTDDGTPGPDINFVGFVERIAGHVSDSWQFEVRLSPEAFSVADF